MFTGGGYLGKAALAAVVASLLTFGGLAYSPVMAADNTTVTDSNGNEVTNTDSKNKDINANITGKNNKVTDSSNAEIVGDNNTVTNKMEGRGDTVRSNDVRIHGSGNFISGSRNQQVIGDNNKIIARDRGTVTDYQHPEGREENVSDLTIGRGNVIQSNDTYRNEWDSLKVIGNNNRADGEWDGYHAGGPSAGIVIGDNQNLNGIQDTIVIGSLAPSEQQKKTEDDGDLYTAGSNNIIIGYHTTTTQHGGIVIGNRSQGSGVFQTIMGPRSIIGNATGNPDSGAGTMASIYGAFNKVEDAGSSNDSGLDIDGLGNSVNGSLNITSNARGTMIMGVGNTITHAKGPDILGKDEDTAGATEYWLLSGLFGADYYAQGADTVAEGNNLNISYDEMRNAWQKYMETSGGAVSVLGNSNNADYAIRSQILGTGNTLQGSETDMSAYNTVSGFANTGTNIKRSAIVGTGNTLKNGEDNVVIGDYHNLENGRHNVILGSMDYTEKQVTKQSKSTGAMTEEHPDGTFEYTVTEQVPTKDHTKDIENAVMVGYNTDVTENGGVALGSDSIASTEAGKTGYDAKGKKHAKSDNDYATWVSTDAAVSVGRAEEKDEKTGKVTSKAITRQITNLAAGTQDTDAVNVAQLKVLDKKVAVIFDDKGSLMSTDATINHEHEIGYGITNVSKGIALGNHAYVYNQGGNKANAMLFKSPTYTSSIAIGENAYALEDSIDLGNKIYKGAMGDVSDLSKYDAHTSSGTGRLLIGNNSYSSGTLSTLIGNHSIMTTNYLNGGSSLNAMQNAGAVSIGALNSIESYSSKSRMSGVANSIIGLANKTTNANGALILGAGNEIKNSITSISVSGSASTDVATASQAIRDRMANGYAGGATLVIGGGNKADYTQKTQIIGVNNKVTGTEGTPADFNLIDGYKNTATHVKHVTVIGSGNTVSGEEKDNVEGLILLGDNRNVWKQADNSVVIGSSDNAHSYVTRPNSVAIGYNAYIEDHGGNNSGGGDVAIGHNAYIENYVNQSGSIALGQNSHIRNSTGSTENAFILNQYETKQDATGVTVPTDVAKMNGSIAIGENTFARTGSLMIGTHKYTGEIGDTTVDTSDATSMAQANQQINETVLGTNSFSLGAFSTVTGAYSIISGDYDKGKWRNFGSSITGALNSIESKTATTADAGNASHIIGTANRMQNANGAVVIGSGNEITDSYAAMNMPTSNNKSAKDLSEKIRESIKANGGGAAAIVGNGNEVKKSTNVAVMGSKNSVTSTTNSQIFGDNRVVTGADGAPIDGAVIIGSADATTPLTTDKKNVTILGHNANATVEGGVALGYGSVASTKEGVPGYDPLTGNQSTYTDIKWKSNLAAASIGDSTHTRQLTNVAAGWADTDAVNVAQLKAVMNLPVHIYNGGKFASNVYTGGTQIATDMTISNLQLDFGDGLKAQEVGNEGDKRVLVTLDKDALKDDPDFKGPKGDPGEQGPKGDKGDKGDTGATGEQGPKGDKGDKGDTGATGEQGPKGDKGDKGDTGATGEQGPKGDKGDKGDTGATGEQGPKGDKGDKGDTGATGEQGPKGDKGDKGDTGATGEQGPKGDKGDKGDTGAPGKDGKDGKDGGVGTVVGDEMNITVANTETDPAKPSNYKVSLKKEITVDKVTAGNTTISSDGLTITGGPSVTQSGINAGDKKITNVADGIISKDSKDAINGSQLYNETRVAKDGTFVKQANTAGENLSALDNQVTANTESIYHINNRVSDLDNRVNKVGAGAAALAALHPLDFDPDDKWDFAVGYGNYRNANSVAFGAFYRPNEDTMFSLGTNFGNGENMFNAGLSFKIGQGGSGITTSKTAMAKTISSLKDTVHKQDQKIEGLENVVDTQDKKIAELEALVKEQGEMIRQYVGKK